MKKFLTKTVSAAMAILMLGTVATACSTNNTAEAVSYVAIDINPSVSLTLDKNDKVLSVYAANEDAQVLLYEEDLIGLTAEEALNKIAELSVELNFINENNYGVDILVEGKVNKDSVIATAQSAFSSEDGDLNVNLSSEGTFSLQRNLNAVKAQYSANASVQNMDISKFRLVLEAQSVDNTLTVTAAAEMDKDELIDLINKAAKTIEPYATYAYNAAVSAAERTYNDAKASLTNKLWIVPYTKDLTNFISGNRKYGINNGLIYNLYADSSLVLANGLAAAEKAAEIANNTEVPSTVTDAITTALKFNDTEKELFITAVSKDGKVTLSSLENYLDGYFKNLTADETAAIKSAIDEVMDCVQTFATEINESVNDEYKEAIQTLCTDITDMIPEEIINLTEGYVAEFKGLINDLTEAIEGKEPMPAAYSVKKAIDTRAESVMQTIREELTDGDLEDVEYAIQSLNSKIEKLENTFREAKEQAETEAKTYLASLKESRQNA